MENARAARTAAQAQIAKATVTIFDAKRDLKRKENLARRSLIARSGEREGPACLAL